MKTIFNLFAGLWLVFIGEAVAREDVPQVGFIRIIHAIGPGEGRAKFFMDGEDLFPKGYELGQRTGGIGLKAGRHKIEVRKEGVEPGSTSIDLRAGETHTLIAFAERLPADRDSQPRWITRILRLKQSEPTSGYRMSVVSVCSEPEVRIEAAAAGKGKIERVAARRLGVVRVDLGRARGEVMVRAGDEILTTVSPDSPGNYVVLLYDDSDGVVRAISFFDPKFSIAG